jgi:hypothetical protein
VRAARSSPHRDEASPAADHFNLSEATALKRIDPTDFKTKEDDHVQAHQTHNSHPGGGCRDSEFAQLSRRSVTIFAEKYGKPFRHPETTLSGLTSKGLWLVTKMKGCGHPPFPLAELAEE